MSPEELEQYVSDVRTIVNLAFDRYFASLDRPAPAISSFVSVTNRESQPQIHF